MQKSLEGSLTIVTSVVLGKNVKVDNFFNSFVTAFGK